MGEESRNIRRLEQRVARERRARAEAEAIAERVTRQLYDAVRKRDATTTAVAELLGAVAAAANQAASMEDALVVALSRVCEYTGWPVGHALAVVTDDEITSLGLWHLEDPEGVAMFRAESEATHFLRGEDLPGRVLATAQPAWINIVAEDPNFARHRTASAAGLATGFAFPVIVRNKVRAVLEFFSLELLDINEAWLHVVAQIGAQLGRSLEREEAEARLTRQGLYDGMTDLPNRVLLMERLEHALRRAVRSGQKVDLLFLDIDDFKTINDSLGHTTGDAVLVEVARRLEACVRNSDTLARPSDATVARLGGDEFAIILEDCQDPHNVAARIAQAMRRPLTVMDAEMFVTMSIGGADNTTIQDAAAMLRSADMALHQAKRGGKDRFELFLPGMQLTADRRLRLATELRGAAEGNQLLLHFQPELDLTNGRAVGVEALVRWQHPQYGIVEPSEFIPLAEESGVIVELGRWVMQEACAAAAGWADDPVLAELSVAVNISGRQLRDPGLARTVAVVLAETGLDPERLLLEVTESVLVENTSVGIKVLTELRSLGVRLAVDDFGTGYSSLAALWRRPVNQLKIDGSFVQGLPDDQDAGTIIRLVIGLGHSLNFTVLAEGVETDGQLLALQKLGCDLGQGYLFSRPVPIEDLHDVVAELADGRFARRSPEGL